MTPTLPIERAHWDVSEIPAPAPRRDEGRHLRIAQPAPERRARLSPVMGAIWAIAVLAAIVAAQLGFSIAISQGAYESRALEGEQRDLIRVERVLSQNVDKLASPQHLAENAAGLGMVQNSQPASLRLSDHAVLGELATRTTAAKGNLIPNATLDQLPVVDAEGLLVTRTVGQAAAAAEGATQTPVAWQGRLPAPETR